ncbi:PLP-dependent aminotransferase family protein [Pectobacterium aroidearum]|uniref:aminotransferase-like domain-containing protein n=1 Tax=Pectobacterium aroidearum TaxID=1201031 RepID=UPI0032F03EF1
MYIYERLAEELANAIINGQLPHGARLQSVRDFALMHQVSINTVKTVYRLLEDRGLISARPQSGYYVNHSLPEQPHSNGNMVPDEEVSLTGVNRLLSVVMENQQRGDCIDLALACPTGDVFYPVSRIKKLMAQHLRSGQHSQNVYCMPPGSKLLRTQVARRGMQLGMYLSADDILITHGAMEALSIAVMASTRYGDLIAVETPTFYNLYPMLENMGRRIVSIPTHPQTGMCMDALKKVVDSEQVAAVLTIPTGHNPLGFIMPEDNRRQLARMARRHEFAVIEDAMYAELQFGERIIPNIKAFDEDGWVMVCASYTKTIAPDFRIGWLDAGRFRSRARQIKFSTSVAESALLSETLGTFLESGGYDLHLRHLRRLYDRQIDTVRACIAKNFPADTRVTRPQGGFILWIELPDGVDTLKLFHIALEAKILCMPGLLCAGNRGFKNCLRMAVCFILTEEYKNGIAQLGQLARRLVHEEAASQN